MHRLALFAAIFAVLTAIGCAASQGGAPAPAPSGKPGMKAPSMVLAGPDGVSHDVSSSKTPGKPFVVYFWSVFCSNCKEAMPLLIELEAKNRERGLTIWAVNVDGDRFTNAVDAFLKDAELPFPVVYDRLEGQYLVAADPLNVSKTPTLFVFAADGVIKLRQDVLIDLPAVEKSLAEQFR